MLIALRKKGIIALILAIVFFAPGSVSSERGPSVQAPDSGLGLLIKKKVTGWQASSKKVIRGERIYSAVLVESFYKGRNYEPAWSQDGRLMQMETLITAVEEAYGDGLTPDYYHLSLIKSLGQQNREKRI